MTRRIRDQACPRPLAASRASRLRGIVSRVYRVGRALFALGMLLQVVIVFTPVGGRLARWLDVTMPPAAADVIVCLGGNDIRQIWAAELYHEGYAPVVVVSNKRGAADVMKTQLVRIGVPSQAVLVDDRSAVTADHPNAIADVMEIDPLMLRVLIVTDKEHSRRAAACFAEAGYRDFRVCTGTSSTDPAPDERGDNWRQRIGQLPRLAYEYAALVKYWMRGDI